ncbi:2266_t:CDS:1, partial [Gigaspora margarita]
MSTSGIPAHIEKTLAKLQAQMIRANIKGSYIVSAQGVTYTTTSQSQTLQVANSKNKTAAQMLRQRLPTFLEDLHSV